MTEEDLIKKVELIEIDPSKNQYLFIGLDHTMACDTYKRIMKNLEREIEIPIVFYEDNMITEMKMVEKK